MANRHRGDTPVEVGGQEFMLCYDLNACAQVMERLGVNSFEAMAAVDLSQIKLSDFLFMLWAGLQRHHPDLHVEEVGAMEWDLNEVAFAIADAFGRGLTRNSPADNGQGSGDTKKKKAKRTSHGTGKRPNA